MTAVNADGSYTVVQQDPSNNSVVVDGTTYAVPTQTITNWRDVLTSVSVKQSITISYAGTPLTGGYPVSRDRLTSA